MEGILSTPFWPGDNPFGKDTIGEPWGCPRQAKLQWRCCENREAFIAAAPKPAGSKSNSELHCWLQPVCSSDDAEPELWLGWTVLQLWGCWGCPWREGNRGSTARDIPWHLCWHHCSALGLSSHFAFNFAVQLALFKLFTFRVILLLGSRGIIYLFVSLNFLVSLLEMADFFFSNPGNCSNHITLNLLFNPVVLI